jgi:molybdopterin/thiamine biosynthesis adenylyltransferase
MNTNNIIRFGTEDFIVIKAHLANSGKYESFIHGLSSTARSKSNTVYICNRLLVPDKKQLQAQSAVSIEPGREYQAITYGLAYDLKKSIIDVHTHPFSSNARFSSIDNSFGMENAKYISENFPDTSTIGMIVLGNGFDNFEAQIWNRGKKCFEPVNRIEILGSPTTILINPKKKVSNKIDDIYARHKIIPGWKQGLLENLKVFVCGLGGNGALIFDSLVSLGIGKHNGWIQACDPDILEESNLPRIPYAYPAEVGISKAMLAKIHAGMKNHELKVFCHEKSVEDKEIQDILKEADIIFGAVDNDDARMILNEHAARYSIPYIDIGSEIIPEDFSYQAMGQVHVFIPGKTACLMCTGAIDPSNAALDSMTEEDKTDYERAGYVRGTSVTPTPSVLHLNGVVSHLAMSQFLKMIFADNFTGKDYLYYDRQKSDIISAFSVQDDQCPVCGLQGYIGNGDENESSLEELSDLKDNSAFEKNISNNKNIEKQMIT